MGSLTLTIIWDLSKSSSALGSTVTPTSRKCLIRIAALLAGAVLDEHFVSAAHQLDAGRGNKSDSPLAGFQLTRNANTHGCPVNMSARSKRQRACLTRNGMNCQELESGAARAIYNGLNAI